MTATSAQAFTAWCRFLAPTEGGFSSSADDPGNWTSGKPGVGELKGTKFGISASAYPSVDIANLTVDEADALRRRDYWDKCQCDAFPPSVAFLLAEAAYGSGPVTAIKQLQAFVGAVQDGVVGEKTIGLVKARTDGMNADAYGLDPLEEFLAEFSQMRLMFEDNLGSLWRLYGGGWTTRLFRGVLIARSLA